MPIPQKQLDRLTIDLQNHEHELEILEASPQRNEPEVRDEIEFHKTVLSIGQDPKVLAALGEINDKPELADQLASNPDAFTRARGIQLPAGAAIVVRKPTPQSVVVGANFQMGKRFHFGLQWDKDSGFSIYQLT